MWVILQQRLELFHRGVDGLASRFPLAEMSFNRTESQCALTVLSAQPVVVRSLGRQLSPQITFFTCNAARFAIVLVSQQTAYELLAGEYQVVPGLRGWGLRMDCLKPRMGKAKWFEWITLGSDGQGRHLEVQHAHVPLQGHLIAKRCFHALENVQSRKVFGRRQVGLIKPFQDVSKTLAGSTVPTSSLNPF